MNATNDKSPRDESLRDKSPRGEPLSDKSPKDVFIIGGGINGVGIARDAAGRGLDVCLAEMGDLGNATSSASTKLFHGGLRYLEYFEINLVRHALSERETLLRAMPHISWPMRFVLPYHQDMRFENTTPTSRILNRLMPWLKGQRPAWLIRLGLFLYDNLGGRTILPGTSQLDLKACEEGKPINDRFEKAYEYSDCWVEDSRLVILNACDAKRLGAEILTHTKVVSCTRSGGIWHITLRDKRNQRIVKAKTLINATGPWVSDIIQDKIGLDSHQHVRLTKGSHIVTKRLYDHDKCYIFQGADGRVLFVIPYENDFTLIGTTDVDYVDPSQKPVCSEAEKQYLLDCANQYFKDNIAPSDIVSSFSGVRPLYDDGAASAPATTRAYVIKLDASDNTPLVNIFGGKITTYRCLAEDVMEKIQGFFPTSGPKWTAGVALPGGNFPIDGFDHLVATLKTDFPFVDDRWAKRLVRAYGTLASDVLGDASSTKDLGVDFGATLFAREVAWLMANEFATCAEDIIWRRSKLGLRLREPQIQTLDGWMAQNDQP